MKAKLLSILMTGIILFGTITNNWIFHNLVIFTSILVCIASFFIPFATLEGYLKANNKPLSSTALDSSIFFRIATIVEIVALAAVGWYFCAVSFTIAAVLTHFTTLRLKEDLKTRLNNE